jgi:hypothetical protein
MTVFTSTPLLVLLQTYGHVAVQDGLTRTEFSKEFR